MYLLRNLSRGRGVGFFEAGNFHPDFILWLLVGKRQYITFVDPKGIRNLEGRSDPKIAFHKTIKELEVRFADTGQGIPAEDVPHLFERFYRADKSRSRIQGRNGLGLASCKAIVDAHSGSIAVSSQVGVGSTFSVRLPQAHPYTATR